MTTHPKHLPARYAARRTVCAHADRCVFHGRASDQRRLDGQVLSARRAEHAQVDVLRMKNVVGTEVDFLQERRHKGELLRYDRRGNRSSVAACARTARTAWVAPIIRVRAGRAICVADVVTREYRPGEFARGRRHYAHEEQHQQDQGEATEYHACASCPSRWCAQSSSSETMNRVWSE